ncbi:COG4280 domain-containing protein [Lichenicoccus sp.]|uniref:COG4280 domain-containing protein n=1 Tax=Lichenicoccus sp. TaxID=2781899 RepID=UPI003D0C09AB
MSPHAISALLASGAASLVECIEALTVVLAVGSTRGWRAALAGAATAIGVLVLLVALLWPALRQVPLAPLRVVLGTLLLLFGARWLRKATRRAAGIIPLRDEAAAFQRQRQHAASAPIRSGRWDGAAFATTFQATVVEGLEVVFIVVAVGSGRAGLWLPAGAGAALALVLVALLGVALHRPITRVPENTLKQIAGALLCGFGTFWIGEGAGLAWPGGDLAMPVLAAAYLLASVIAARILRRRLAIGFSGPG